MYPHMVNLYSLFYNKTLSLQAIYLSENRIFIAPITIDKRILIKSINKLCNFI